MSRPQTLSARYLRATRNILVILAAVSLFQYLLHGEVTWHHAALRKITEMAGGHSAGTETAWHRATKQVEELGARKEGQPLPNFDLKGRVTGVLDGDSIIILDESGEKHTIRLFGIDTPERGQPHADTARNAMRKLATGKQAGVVSVGRDRYTRTVATVYVEGDNINLAMVKNGHAWWYRRYAPHDRLLEAAEKEAREAQRGLWAEPDPVPPWEWRRARR